MVENPLCRLCGQPFKEHVVYHDPADVPRRAKEGLFDGVDASGLYCRRGGAR